MLPSHQVKIADKPWEEKNCRRLTWTRTMLGFEEGDMMENRLGKNTKRKENLARSSLLYRLFMNIKQQLLTKYRASWRLQIWSSYVGRKVCIEKQAYLAIPP